MKQTHPGRLLLLLVSLLVLTLLAGTALADTISSDDETASYTFTVLEDGTAALRSYRPNDRTLSVQTLPATVPDKQGNTYTVSALDSEFSAGSYNLGDVRTLVIPDSISITADQMNPFINARDLEDFVVSDNHPTLTVMDGVLFNKVEKSLLCYPSTKQNPHYEIPEGITAIAPHAFYALGNTLVSVKLPDSLAVMKSNPFISTSIQEFILSENHPHFAMLDCALYDIETRMLITVTKKASMIPQFIIPEGITAIAPYALCYINISAAVTPSTLTDIGDYAFTASGLKNGITLSEGLRRIGFAVFRSCQFTEIKLPDSLVEIGGEAFRDTQLKSIRIPAQVTSLPRGLLADNSRITEIVLPDTLTEIDSRAFDSCSALKTIVIPDSVRTVGAAAFSSCKNLRYVTLPKGLEILNNQVFENCTALESITLPEGLKVIRGAFPFYNCTALTEVILPEGLQSMGGWIFKGCTALKTLVIPESVEKLEKTTFDGTEGLVLSVSYNSPAEAACIRYGWEYVLTDGQPEPDVPDWLKPTEPPYPDVCPNCGYDLPDEPHYNYCPNCGIALR